LATTADKIMFEIYREADYNRRFHAVYFTELDEHNKEYEINAALAGEHVYSGFIAGQNARDAKAAIHRLLNRLNAGESLDEPAIEQEMEPFVAA
jgi:hypothetical protein